MLKPRQRLATARPMRPKPTMPTVAPWSRPVQQGAPAALPAPAIVLEIRCAAAAIRAKAWSATASWLVPNAIATATPCRVAAGTSTCS